MDALICSAPERIASKRDWRHLLRGVVPGGEPQTADFQSPRASLELNSPPPPSPIFQPRPDQTSPERTAAARPSISLFQHVFPGDRRPAEVVRLSCTPPSHAVFGAFTSGPTCLLRNPCLARKAGTNRRFAHKAAHRLCKLEQSPNADALDVWMLLRRRETRSGACWGRSWDLLAGCRSFASLP